MEPGDSQRPSDINANPPEDDDKCEEEGDEWVVDYSCTKPILSWLPSWPWFCVVWNECNPGLAWGDRHRRPLLTARFVVLVVGVIFGCLAFLGVSDKPAIITSFPWGIITHTLSSNSTSASDDVVLATFWSNLWGVCVGLNNVTFLYLGAPAPEMIERFPLVCMSFGGWSSLHEGVLPENWNCGAVSTSSNPFCDYFLTGHLLSLMPVDSNDCHQHNSSNDDCQKTASSAPSSTEEEGMMEHNKAADYNSTTFISKHDYWSEAYGSCASHTTGFVSILSVSLAMNIIKAAGSFTRCSPEDDHNAKCFNLLSSGLPFLIQSSILLTKYADCYMPLESGPADGRTVIFAVGVGIWCTLVSIACNSIIFIIDMIIPSGPTRYIKKENSTNAKAASSVDLALPGVQEMTQRDYGDRRAPATTAAAAVDADGPDGAAAVSPEVIAI